MDELKLTSHHIPSSADYPPEGQKRFKLVIEYDGTAYSGWQRQMNGPSVQQTLEEALSRLTGEKIAVTGSSRTDAGVHAFGVGYGEREYLRHDVAPYTSGRHARRRPFRTSYGLILEKTKNRNLSIPVVCAPAGIRTLDTLIKSQLL